MKKYKILMVDDDKFLTEMYERKLKEAGFEVLILDNFENNFIEKVVAFQPDLISLDIIVPGIDGLQAAEWLKNDSRTKDIPFSFLSNLGQKEDIEKAVSLGAVGYIVCASATPSEVIKMFSQFIELAKSKKADQANPTTFSKLETVNKKAEIPMPSPNKTKNLATIVAAIFLSLAIADSWPYGFFTLLRFVVCASTIFLAWRSYVANKKGWAWAFVIIAVLFNPLIPVHLQRDTWVVIDIITGLFLTASLFFFKIPNGGQTS